MQVTDLRAQLGSAAVPCPAMDIGSSFTTIANAALNVYGFFPYNTDINFLLGKLLHASICTVTSAHVCSEGQNQYLAHHLIFSCRSIAQSQLPLDNCMVG